MRAFALLAFTTFTLSFACAGDPEAAPGGFGGTGGSAGQGGSGGGAGGSGGAGGGDPLSCVKASTEKPELLTFRFVNGGAQTLYLANQGDCGFSPAFSLSRCDGKSLTYHLSCTQCICGACSQGGYCGQACPDCAPLEGPIAVEPMGTSLYRWGGTLYLPGDQGSCKGACFDELSAPAGTYTLAFQVRASRDGEPVTRSVTFTLPDADGMVDVPIHTAKK